MAVIHLVLEELEQELGFYSTVTLCKRGSCDKHNVRHRSESFMPACVRDSVDAIVQAFQLLRRQCGKRECAPRSVFPQEFCGSKLSADEELVVMPKPEIVQVVADFVVVFGGCAKLAGAERASKDDECEEATEEGDSQVVKGFVQAMAGSGGEDGALHCEKGSLLGSLRDGREGSKLHNDYGSREEQL
ncbi:hypothetical protein L7F22_034663 [Adiantum nelumboides]|nr:hypothetical protein [Adiantum nelumboides]MCO5580792.1 hypothetical protein [Adiantum nelumboides]